MQMESKKPTPEWQVKLNDLFEDVRQSILWDKSDGLRGRPLNIRTSEIAELLLMASDLRGANLTGLDLSGVDFSSVYFRGPERIVVSHVKFDYATLKEVTFNKANLSRVGFDRADLEDASFVGANLSGATFRNAKLRYSSFQGATTEGCKFEGADLEGADLRQTDFEGISFERANLTSAKVNGAKFSRADLSRAILEGVDFSACDLSHAKFSGAIVRKASFRGANLVSADLSGLDLSGADFSGAILVDADLNSTKLDGAQFKKALLHGTNLQYARLLQTDLTGAALTGASVYGTSVWDVLTDAATEQKDLIITPGADSKVTVDDIEVAQFIYLLVDNKKIHQVIDTITSKVVLILGRFIEDRKAVLDRLRDELRKLNLSPVLFDFDPSSNLDISDTVTLLARMARFVIADLTDPMSVQQELTFIAPQVMVAIRPIILAGRQPWSMFGDLRRRSRGLLSVHEYRDMEDLVQGLQSHVIAPAEAKRMELLPSQTVA
jgi:uncharacterized protein YjbI with pentapeptide repeats